MSGAMTHLRLQKKMEMEKSCRLLDKNGGEKLELGNHRNGCVD